MAVDLIGTIVTILVFAAIVGFCCSGESDSPSNTSQKNTPPEDRTHITHHTTSANALHAERRAMTATARSADTRTSTRDGLGKTIRKSPKKLFF